MDMAGRRASSHERETLELAAALAHELAPQLCRKKAGGDSCAWLHAFWPSLRLANLAATPDRHAAFYGAAFAALDARSPRVLVSGAADHGMLACVLEALPRAHATVIDSCETPLHLNRWYAQRLGTKVETHRSSVIDYAPSNGFDVICSHSFFGQFSREERPRLLAAWRRLLRPGGKVITANPLRPFGADEPNQFTPQQKSAFYDHMAAAAPELARLLQTAEEEVRRLADSYTRARYGYPVRSADELAELFDGAGFDLESLACDPAPQDAPAGSGGPGLRNPAVHYAQVIARRR